jgi:protein TonB
MENLKHPTNMPGISEPPPAPATLRPRAVLKIAVTESRYVAPKVVDSLPPMEKSLVNTPDSINGTITDLGDINGTGNEKGSLTGGTGTGGNGNGGNGLYSKVEVMPTFKGGDINKFREWVQKKTKYPEIATINGIQGKVYVTFIVEKDGSVTNGKVVKGVDPVIDNEALKSVMSSPKWSPGKERGDAVRVSFIIMLNFQL